MKPENQQLSALEIHYLIKELQYLIGSKVDKIFQPEKKQLILQLHKTGEGKTLLNLQVPEYFCITQTKLITEKPMPFCAYLRKKLGNTFIETIKQIGFERIIEIEFKTKETKLSLIFELFSPGNIILVEKKVILSALEQQEYKDRTIKPKHEYKHPTKEYNYLILTEQQLKEIIQKTNKESIVKTLATDLGLGGTFAEEACNNANIDKNKKPAEIVDINELYSSLQQLTNKKIKPSKIETEIIPFELTSKKTEPLDVKTFNEAVNQITKQTTTREQQGQQKIYLEKLKKIQNMIDSQEKTIKQLTKKEQDQKQKGDLIYTNYQQIQEILNETKKDQKEKLQQLKQNKKIKEYDLKEKTITIELE